MEDFFLTQISEKVLFFLLFFDYSLVWLFIKNLQHTIEVHLSTTEDWNLFEKNFNQVHDKFLKNLKADFPELTPGDLQLSAYLKMNLTSKEIAPLLHISIRGVENKRYRLRKKLGITTDSNLTEFVMKY